MLQCSVPGTWCSDLKTYLISVFVFCPVRLLGESDAQTAASFPQRHLCLLCWQPAAVGTDPQAVQHKAQTSRS